MRITNNWRDRLRGNEPDELADLRRESLVGLASASVVVGWFMMLHGLSFRGDPAYLAAGALLSGGAVACFGLRRTGYRAGLYLLVLTMLATLVVLKVLSPDSVAQYFFSLIVVVSSLLVSGPQLFFIAGLGVLAIVSLALGQGAGLLDAQQVVAPLILILLTASAAWLAARRANLALIWLQSAHHRAEGLVEELRDERMSLARVLKVLEQAYVRIEKMNYALVEARTAAEHAQRLKAEFAANVSHELRTPLNIIIGFAETMTNAPETYRDVLWSPELRGDMEEIYRSARHLTALIDDILDLSALEVRRLGLTTEENGIQDLILDAVGVANDLFHAKGLYLRVDVEPNLPVLRVDPTRIRQVLINLLSNASRFTNTGGVTIRARRDGDFIEVAVCDTGIGIAPEDVPRVFEDFGQVDGTAARRHGGTGLGVPLSRRLVELHGGRMWLESRPGEGTQFYFTLPVTASSPSPDVGSLPLPARRSPYRRTVLLAEQDPMLGRVIRRYLSAYDVIVAPPGADFATLVAEHQPVALIIDPLDASAPEGRTARRPEALPPGLPTIALTLQGTLRTAFALGLQNYLIKPVLREELLEAVARVPEPVRQVLIVDDDLQLVDVLARMLQSAEPGYRTRKAHSGAEALERLRAEPIDLVLLDLMIGDTTGLAVVEAMRQDPKLAEIPVILVTGQYPESVIMSAGLDVRLTRVGGATITETLQYLQALLDALPPGRPRYLADEPAPPADRAGRPAS